MAKIYIAMKKNTRQSTVDALNKYYSRLAKEQMPKEPRAANEKPEKEVEKECTEWMRERGWSVQIFEAKATFDPKRGVWRNQSMKAGTCDCLGNTAQGESVAIEFKAKGRLSSFNRPDNHKQREFITDKINTNAFACVVDSKDRLEAIYIRWAELKAGGHIEEARKYLILKLPVLRSTDDFENTLFAEDD